MTQEPTDDQGQVAAATENPARAGGVPLWVKAGLFVSLAANIAIIGLVAGARFGAGQPLDNMRSRDVGFGVMVEAFTREQKRELGASARDLAQRTKTGDGRENRAAARQYRDGLLKALRADPYDALALAKILTRQQEDLEARQAVGRTVLETQLQNMTPAERAAYADRLEQALRGGDGRPPNAPNRDGSPPEPAAPPRP